MGTFVGLEDGLDPVVGDAEAAELPAAELPRRRRRPLDLAPYRREVGRLRRAVVLLNPASS